MSDITRMMSHEVLDERIENNDFSRSLPKHYAGGASTNEEWMKGQAMFISENWDEMWENKEQFDVYMKVIGQSVLRYLIGGSNARALIEEVKYRDQG